MANEGAPDDPTRLVHKVQKDVLMTRWQFLNEYMHGSVSTATRRELVQAILRYHSILAPLKSNPVVDDDAYPDISPIKTRLGERVTQLVPSQRLGVKETTTTRPAIDELPAAYLIDVIDDLDQVANMLGFGPTTAEAVPNDEATHEDLKALLTARGQTEAVENLPGE